MLKWQRSLPRTGIGTALTTWWSSTRRNWRVTATPTWRETSGLIVKVVCVCVCVVVYVWEKKFGWVAVERFCVRRVVFINVFVQYMMPSSIPSSCPCVSVIHVHVCFLLLTEKTDWCKDSFIFHVHGFLWNKIKSPLNLCLIVNLYIIIINPCLLDSQMSLFIMTAPVFFFLLTGVNHKLIVLDKHFPLMNPECTSVAV